MLSRIGDRQMIELRFKTKSNGVPIVSKKEIEYFAEMIINDYNPEIIKNPTILDIEDFLEFYVGLEIDYKDLTHDKSIIGMMVFSDGNIIIYDAEENKAKRIRVNEGTILIDNSLLQEKLLARGRFTLCHELAHWILHRHMFTVDKNQMSLFDDIEEEKEPVIKCRNTDIEYNNKKKFRTDNDWMEWQADYMASALLMPKNIFINIVKKEFNNIGIKDGFYQKGTSLKTDLSMEQLCVRLAKIFNVSVIAAEIRLKNLGFIIEQESNEQLRL